MTAMEIKIVRKKLILKTKWAMNYLKLLKKKMKPLLLKEPILK